MNYFYIFLINRITILLINKMTEQLRRSSRIKNPIKRLSVSFKPKSKKKNNKNKKYNNNNYNNYIN